MKILMSKNEVEDFVTTAKEITGGGFSFYYDKDGLVLKNLKQDLSDWKSRQEYANIMKTQKYNKTISLISERQALKEIISSHVPSQDIKEKAQSRVDAINAKLLGIFS